MVPLVALLGDSLPTVESERVDSRAEASESLGDDPVGQLRARYGQGELTDAAFERRLERLLETENVESDDSTERVFDRE